MKKLLYSFGITLSLVLLQCSNELPTSNNIDLELGKVSLKIDKANAPAEVVLVEAFLVREGYDSLYGQLNILDSTSADIVFIEVEAGEWHLKVDAKDDEGVVIYTGETNVTILAGILTQVNLTLIPTGNGKGNIYILVNWGVNPVWTEYGSPIISQSIIPDNPVALFHPRVLFDDGIYKMWVTAVYYSAYANIWYLISNDGINWELGNNTPVLLPGNYYSWDSHMVGSSIVIKEENQYRMYYGGFSDENGYWHIGLATSSDGINWIKHPDPVIYAEYNEPQIGPTDVIKIDSSYYLYYTSRQYPHYDIRVAVSPDGKNFSRANSNPILVPEKNWEGTGIYSASIVNENNQYKMVYASVNSSETGLGFAYSNDGINWSKDNNNPFFSSADINWCERISYPFFRKINNHLRIYYTGSINGDNAKIGMIYK